MRAVGERTEAGGSAAPGRKRSLTSRGVLGLQRKAGNSAVARLILQRRASAEAPTAPVGLAPRDDPRFRKVEAELKQTNKTLTTHPPATAEANKAAAAAEPPGGDRDAQAKAAKADKMAGAKPGGFDKAAFMAAVRRAIAAKAPQNLDEADKFAGSGAAGAVKSDVMANVTGGKEASAKDIATKTAEAPDPSKARDKPVTPLKEEPAPKPPVPNAAAAMPTPAPPEQTQLDGPKHETDAQMAEAGVTEKQLAESNEPEFTGAVAAKKAGEQHSATAPGEVREAEGQTLQNTAQGAGAAGKNAVGAMIAGRGSAQDLVGGDKTQAKAKDEAARSRITADINRIFDATKTEVDGILNGLDASVAQRFDAGAAAATAAFEADHKARMQRYKDVRYEGWEGAARWTADLFTGLPKEANDLFLQSKKLYESKMDQVISEIADHIGAELGKATERIAKGRKEISDYVASQPKELQKVVKDCAGDVEKRLGQLQSDVDAKGEALVDDLATRYSEARDAIDQRIQELQDANKGLWDKAKEAVGGAIETILKLKDMLLGVLARAAGAIDKIIADPIGFLGKLVNAVRGGVTRFASNIVSHLKKGLQGWLFGTLASAGIEIPDTFDLRGVIKLVLSILGLTWTRIRTKIVARIGEAAMNALESGVDFFKTLVTQGIGGLWTFLIDKLADLKDTVMSAIQDFVVVKIVKAGIVWLISALNPAAAFIKACKMIYDVVMFFVEKGSQIKEFVDSVLDSIEEIAGGAVGRVAGFIENTLAKILPLLIGFLASLLGLGGISEKIKEILQKVQEPVAKAVDFVINGALKLAAPVINLAKRGVAWVKGKLRGGDDSPEGKQQRLTKGMAAGLAIMNRFKGKKVADALLRPALGAVRVRYGMTSLEPRAQGARWVLHGAVNPELDQESEAEVSTGGLDPNDPVVKELQGLGLGMDAIQRVFDKAPHADHVKGELLEALFQGSHKPAAEEQRFIPGRSVKTPDGQDFSDGIDCIIASDASGPTIKIIKIHEVKSGSSAVRKLGRERDRFSRISQDALAELRNDTIEDILAERYPIGSENPTPEQERAHNARYRPVVRSQHAAEIESRLKSKYEQSEHLGQPARDLERISPDVDMETGAEIPAALLIDGVRHKVVEFSRGGITTTAHLPTGQSAGRIEETVGEQGVEFELQRIGLSVAALRSLTGRIITAATAMKAAAGGS